MSILNLKIPKFKMPKFKMSGLSEIEELKIDAENVEKNKNKKRDKNYENPNFKTIKEVFNKSTDF